MVDWERVRALRDEIGAEDFDEVVALFLEEADPAIAALSGEGRAGPDALHFLKGAALNLGFAALADHCAAAERQARSEGASTPESAASSKRRRGGSTSGASSAAEQGAATPRPEPAAASGAAATPATAPRAGAQAS